MKSQKLSLPSSWRQPVVHELRDYSTMRSVVDVAIDSYRLSDLDKDLERVYSDLEAALGADVRLLGAIDHFARTSWFHHAFYHERVADMSPAQFGAFAPETVSKYLAEIGLSRSWASASPPAQDLVARMCFIYMLFAVFERAGVRKQMNLAPALATAPRLAAADLSVQRGFRSFRGYVVMAIGLMAFSIVVALPVTLVMRHSSNKHVIVGVSLFFTAVAAAAMQNRAVAKVAESAMGGESEPGGCAVWAAYLTVLGLWAVGFDRIF